MLLYFVWMWDSGSPTERLLSALHLIGARAEEAVFVGDDPRWDVLGARQAGIQPILLAKAAPDVAIDGVLMVQSLMEARNHIHSIGSA
jgi:FMN phosphatase YigB (HAD superfamily)